MRASGDPNFGVVALQEGLLGVGVLGPHQGCLGGATQMYVMMGLRCSSRETSALRAAGDTTVGLMAIQGGLHGVEVVAPIRGVPVVRVGDTQMLRMVGPRCWNTGTSTLRTSGGPAVGPVALHGGFLSVGVVGPHQGCPGGATQMFRVVGPRCWSRGTSTLRASGDPIIELMALQGGFLSVGVVGPHQGCLGGATQMIMMVGPRCWNGGTSTLRTSGDPSVGLMALLGGFLNVG